MNVTMETSGQKIIYTLPDWEFTEVGDWLEFKGAVGVSDEIINGFTHQELIDIRDKAAGQIKGSGNMFLKDGYSKLALAAEILNALLMKENVKREDMHGGG